MKILVTHDVTVQRLGIQALLEKTKLRFTKIETAKSSSEMASRFNIENYDLVICAPAIILKESLNNSRLFKQINNRAKIMLFSEKTDAGTILTAIEQGFSAIIPPNVDSLLLEEMIRNVVKNDYYLLREQAVLISHVLYRRHVTKDVNFLSPIEREVIRLTCLGKSCVEIGELIHRSKRTVDAQRIKIRKKTGCKNIAELVAFAVKYGLDK